MANFGVKSNNNLSSCDIRLVRLFTEVVKNYNCSILQGHRDKKTQEEYFNSGKSKVKYPNSKHNSYPSKAIDVAPYPIDWEDTNRFYHFAGYVKGIADRLGIKLRWGGDWDGDLTFSDQSFNDLVHFELLDE